MHCLFSKFACSVAKKNHLRARMLLTSRAFTLIELLVTITIIAVLAALILAATQTGMSSAKGVKKVANLRSIGAAHGLYLADNSGLCLPTNLDYTGTDPVLAGNRNIWWCYYLMRFASGNPKMFLNPDFRLPDGSTTAIWDDVPNPSTGITKDELPGQYARIEAGFGWNWYQSSATPGDQGEWSNGPNNPRPMAAINSPSKLIICLESMSVVGGPNPSIGLNFQAWLNSVRADPNFFAGPRWSKGGITCLFFDGHVSQMKPDDFTVENFDLLK